LSLLKSSPSTVIPKTSLKSILTNTTLDKVLAKRKKLDNMKSGWKLFALILTLIICLGLSVGSVISCKFAEAKNEKLDLSMPYGLFSFHGFNFIFDGEHNYDAAKEYYGDDYSNDKCYTYNDNSSNIHDYGDKTTIHKVAMAMGLLTVLVLALSILLASFLGCKDFSRKLIHWIQFFLIIACLSSTSLLFLVPRKEFHNMFDRSDVKFSYKKDSGCAYCTAVMTFLCLIFTCCCKCNKLPKPYDDENKNVKVVVKGEGPVHVPDEEAEIHLPKEVEPEVYVHNVNGM